VNREGEKGIRGGEIQLSREGGEGKLSSSIPERKKEEIVSIVGSGRKDKFLR